MEEHGEALEEDWRSIGRGLEEDWRSIGGALEEEGMRIEVDFRRCSKVFNGFCQSEGVYPNGLSFPCANVLGGGEPRPKIVVSLSRCLVVLSSRSSAVALLRMPHVVRSVAPAHNTRWPRIG